MSGPLFSVIIPTYGRGDFLTVAVRSVRDQTLGDFECLIVDDASPVPVRVPPDSRIRVIRRAANGGPAAARNSGLQEARGRYVTFIDDDDIYVPERLAMALEGLERAPLATCWMRYVDAPPRNHRTLEGNVADTILDSLIPHLGTVAMRREDVLPFDERFTAAEDVDWWLRMAQVLPVTTVKRVGYLFQRHVKARHRIDLPARILGRLQLMRVHAAYFQAHPRAAAFQWKRMGLLARRYGDYRLARWAFLRSLTLRPGLDIVWHLAHSVRFTTARAAEDDSSEGAKAHTIV